MSRILSFFQPWAGHVYTIVPTLLELQRHGHEVALATATDPESPFCHWGLDTARLSAVAASVTTAVLPTEPDGSAAHAALISAWGAPVARMLERLIDTEQPDCVLIDPILWGGMIAAEASGLPWVKIAHSCTLIPTTGFRLLGPGLAPPRGLRARMGQYVAALIAARQADACYLPMINAVRASHGVPALAHVEDSTRRAPLTLALTAEPFEYPRSDWHPSVRFVGPATWEPPAATEGFLPRKSAHPLVLVSSSSLPQADARLVAVALEALADEPVQVIATIPQGWEPNRVPRNAQLARHVPHGLLLSHTSCVICHGGPGTTQKALAAGVPVVAVPFGRDQFEVARRVEVAAAGVRILPETLTPERLRAAVREALSCRPGAERVAAAFRQAGGARAAAVMIEELLLGRTTPRWEPSGPYGSGTTGRLALRS